MASATRRQECNAVQPSSLIPAWICEGDMRIETVMKRVER